MLDSLDKCLEDGGKEHWVVYQISRIDSEASSPAIGAEAMLFLVNRLRRREDDRITTLWMTRMPTLLKISAGTWAC